MDIASIFNITKQENAAIDEAINSTLDANSTDEQKVFYQETQASYIKFIGIYLFYAYYFVVICVLYVLIFRQTNISKFTRIGIFIAFVIYPFIIGYIESTVLEVISYSYAIISGTVYRKFD
jgi:hypothetical protein